MTYNFQLTVNNDSSILKLFKGDELIMEKSWPEERDMGKQLLVSLEQILSEIKIKPEMIATFLVTGEAPENFTSRRIAETVSRVYNFAIDQR